ncbi:hypothetical protein SY27_17055 [Flavobacterium sp. 316]|uniref:DUF983 domain-containing protein n=1 Tax=Flavobacterium sediminilitoris TaxID=2024526 RepID=A0ABY4HQD2_9FLAO|nr:MULTISPECIES: DUF983 domain-containing protein [Flavobacterium]KIX19766.1 hypothetical protein SY27_17055 [Flavobacterium sp. 316]UOX33994.1 DUF983 domain-containing protein [Flavobacterium sediminilitoris]
MKNLIMNLFSNKCPNCNKGKVFKNGLINFGFGFPKMNENCPNCNLKFEKEPGFFFGAMFVNYAVGCAEALITYFIAAPFFDKTFDLRIFPIIGIVILCLSITNIKLSRLIWIYIFKNYSK